MANRRARTRRKDNVIIETLSNKTFLTLSSILILIITACILIMTVLKVNEKRRIAYEKSRIEAQIDEIYSSTSIWNISK